MVLDGEAEAFEVLDKVGEYELELVPEAAAGEVDELSDVDAFKEALGLHERVQHLDFLQSQ